MHFFAALAFAVQADAADPSLTAPPELRSQCRCKSLDGAEAVTIRGFAIDGEIRVAENGRDPMPRQATVFRVLSANGVEAQTPFKVWHMTAPDQCGVTFDYGKLYVVVLRRSGEEYETDQCLMRSAAPKEGE